MYSVEMCLSISIQIYKTDGTSLPSAEINLNNSRNGESMSYVQCMRLGGKNPRVHNIEIDRTHVENIPSVTIANRINDLAQLKRDYDIFSRVSTFARNLEGLFRELRQLILTISLGVG